MKGMAGLFSCIETRAATLVVAEQTLLPRTEEVERTPGTNEETKAMMLRCGDFGG